MAVRPAPSSTLPGGELMPSAAPATSTASETTNNHCASRPGLMTRLSSSRSAAMVATRKPSHQAAISLTPLPSHQARQPATSMAAAAASTRVNSAVCLAAIHAVAARNTIEAARDKNVAAPDAPDSNRSAETANPAGAQKGQARPIATARSSEMRVPNTPQIMRGPCTSSSASVAGSGTPRRAIPA